jgi:hypothetical protein
MQVKDTEVHGAPGVADSRQMGVLRLHPKACAEGFLASFLA